MNPSSLRKRIALWMLVGAAVQPAGGVALLASALSLHAHAASLVWEEGHLHLVLSHDSEQGSDHLRNASTPHLDALLASSSESDHVLHLASEELLKAPSRRGDAALIAFPTIAVASFAAPAMTSVFQSPPAPRARGADHLRTVLLRL